MATAYATYAEFTAVYSVKGISQAEITSTWIYHGALRVNEALGAYYTTPFSSNNYTAKDLSIHYAYLGILNRTRNKDDSLELDKTLSQRVKQLQQGEAQMILDDGTAIYPDRSSKFDAWSTTQNYKPTFDIRDAEDQRIDPDLVDDTWNSDL